MKRLNQLMMLGLAGLLLIGCSKEDDVTDPGPPPAPAPFMDLTVTFTQNFNGVDLDVNDTIRYENLSGNILSVAALRYLVSNIRISDWDGGHHYIDEYHLVDATDPNTLTFEVKDSIPKRDIQSISLDLGFREDDNITGKYTDLDNKGWGWPPKWGGGYYTLQMDGRYLSDSDDETPDAYDMALGGNILFEGQVDTLYIPNPIVTSLLGAQFDIPTADELGEEPTKMNIEIILAVDKLFKDINGFANYNLDVYTSNIEEDAQGSKVLTSNFSNAFSLGFVQWNDMPIDE